MQRKRDKIRKGLQNKKRETIEEGKKQWEIELIRFNHEEYYSPLHPHFEHFNKVFDKIDYFSTDWNNQYNKHFFEAENIDKVCEEYYKSLHFCMKYYYDYVPSWSWYYKYNAAPSMRQFTNYLEKQVGIQILWEQSTPCTQFEQLMYILPKQSFKLLPKLLSDISDEYYPKNFTLNIVYGTKFIYSEPLLPDIPIEVIKEKIKECEEQFTLFEKERNTLRFKPYIYKDKI
jgi:5'-3' exonuclease